MLCLVCMEEGSDPRVAWVLFAGTLCLGLRLNLTSITRKGCGWNIPCHVKMLHCCVGGMFYLPICFTKHLVQ